VLGQHDISGGVLRDTRTGLDRLPSAIGLLRLSVFGRLAGYDDVNDADRLALDPVMRQIVGGRAVDAKAASANQMGQPDPRRTGGQGLELAFRQPVLSPFVRLQTVRAPAARQGRTLRPGQSCPSGQDYAPAQAPVGRPPNGARRIAGDFKYQAA